MVSSKKENILINLEIERSKINREKSRLVLDKALMLYFSFLILGILGFINGYVTPKILNLMILMSFGVLVVGITPYFITMRKEEKNLDNLIRNARR
ncbi:hypothetical protein HYU11_03685 [Candidatus Woesearchaeota archaeon]|nr:hypothetical protein [Candidatus Woesearchaeota archaeon]